MTIEVINLRIDRSESSEEVHFSGGLRAFPTSRGWALFPVSGDPDADCEVFESPQALHAYATKEGGLQFVGTCMHHELTKNSPPMDVWEPGSRDPMNGLNAADSWSAIGDEAAARGDEEYANSAAYVSVCLKVAGLRVRDVSNRYHQQLGWALQAGTKPGVWFSNYALFDLYADCHSLVSELSSTRDHLARLAAIHVGAPSGIDSFARLENWLLKAPNRTHVVDPFIALLISAAGDRARPAWLRRLGDVRNEMLHKVPMGGNTRLSGLTLQEIVTSRGAITTIRLAEPLQRKPLAEQGPDPLLELCQLSGSMELLARAAWKVAKYPAVIPTLVARPDA